MDDIIQFPRMLRPADISSGNYDEDAWDAYRVNEFGPRILAYLKALYPDKFPSTGEPDPEGCYYDDPEMWGYTDVRITARGLKLTTSLPRFARRCDNPEWSYIPYETIREFLNPDCQKTLLTLKK